MLPQKDGLKKKQLCGILLFLSVLLGLFAWQNGRFLRADTNFPQYLPFIASEENGEATASPTPTVRVTWTTIVVPTRTPTATGTATPTPSSTPAATPSATPTLLPTPTATATATLIPASCGAFFISTPIAGTTSASVTGEIGASVDLINLTTGQLLGTDTFVAESGFACPGFAGFYGQLQPLIAGHVLLSVPSVGQPASVMVIPPTPIPGYCGAYFEMEPMAGVNFVWVTGEVGAIVTIIDLTTGQLLGMDTFIALPGHICPGFADFSGDNALIEPLQEGHVLLAYPSLGSPDYAMVVVYTPTPMPTSTVPGKGR